MPRGSSSPISRLLKTVRAAFSFRHLEDFRDAGWYETERLFREALEAGVNYLDIATAYHEAGHAVVARYLGVPVKSLKIDSSGGIVKLGNVIPESRRTGSTKLLRLGIAGEVAVQVKFGDWDRHDVSDDRQKFHSLVQYLAGLRGRVLPGSTVASVREYHREQCLEILSQPEVWEWLEAVAESALERGFLTGEEIDGLRPTRGE